MFWLIDLAIAGNLEGVWARKKRRGEVGRRRGVCGWKEEEEEWGGGQIGRPECFD